MCAYLVANNSRCQLWQTGTCMHTNTHTHTYIHCTTTTGIKLRYTSIGWSVGRSVLLYMFTSIEKQTNLTSTQDDKMKRKKFQRKFSTPP